jgi:plastocyanin
MRYQSHGAKRTLVGCLLVSAALTIGACGGDDSEGVSPPAQDGGGTDVVIPITIQAMDNRFEPATLSIPLGTMVRWINVGANRHTVTSGQGSSSPGVGSGFDAQLGAGEAFSHTFNMAGDHPYFCRLHEATGMKGTITVMP